MSEGSKLSLALTRRTLLAGAAAALGAAAVTPAHAQPRLAYDLSPFRIADGVWMIQGAMEHFTKENGGAILNVVLIEAPDGIIVIDTGSSRRYGETLREVANGLHPNGVAALVNTHHHPDHFFGNQVFADKPIHALPGTIEAAARDGDGFADNLYRLLGDWMRGTEPMPPGEAITSSTLTLGGREFTTVPLAGHTSADLALLDRQTGTLIAGDLLFLDRAPTTPHADLSEWRRSLDWLAGMAANVIVPGHGPAETSKRAIEQTRGYLDWLDARLRAGAAEGLSMVEVMDEAVPPPWSELAVEPDEYFRSVSHLYPEIEASILPLAE